MKRLFQIGQRIVFIDSKLKGRVVKSDSNELIIELEDGLNIPASPTEIMAEPKDFVVETPIKKEDSPTVRASILPVDPDIWSQHHSIKKVKTKSELIPKEKRNLSAGKSSKKKKKTESIPEIDLHLETLVSENIKISPGDALTIQLQRFKEFIELCRLNKTRKAIVIHGEGKGVLRSKVREYIEGCADCYFEDAPLHQYGTGATTIIFSKNNTYWITQY